MAISHRQQPSATVSHQPPPFTACFTSLTSPFTQDDFVPAAIWICANKFLAKANIVEQIP
jgi:hypothetical protein